MGRKKDYLHKDSLPLPGFEGAGKEAVGLVYDELKKVDRELQRIIKTHPVRPCVENEFELCQEIAVSLKQEIRESGLSREQFADAVNQYFGRTDERHKLGECRKPLTKDDIDKTISDAPGRPIHAYYLYAFQHILGFGVADTIVGAKGAQVVSQEDRRLLALARINDLEVQLRAARKTLKK